MENPFKFGTIVEDEYNSCFPEKSSELANDTGCHPYYTQQLASNVWQIGMLQPDTTDTLPQPSAR